MAQEEGDGGLIYEVIAEKGRCGWEERERRVFGCLAGQISANGEWGMEDGGGRQRKEKGRIVNKAIET